MQNNGIRDRKTQSGYLQQERTPKADRHDGTDTQIPGVRGGEIRRAHMQRRTERGREGRLPESHEGVPAIVRTLLYLLKGSEKRGPDETDPPDHAADPRLLGSAYDAGVYRRPVSAKHEAGGTDDPQHTGQGYGRMHDARRGIHVRAAVPGTIPGQAAVCHSGGRHIQTQGKDYR